MDGCLRGGEGRGGGLNSWVSYLYSLKVFHAERVLLRYLV